VVCDCEYTISRRLIAIAGRKNDLVYSYFIEYDSFPFGKENGNGPDRS